MNLNWQVRECISSVMRRRASLDSRDELLSGVSISLALSSEECSAVECRWSAVVFFWLRKQLEACRSEKDFEP